MSLGLRLRLIASGISGWLAERHELWCTFRAKVASPRMKRAFLVRLAVDATRPELIGPDAYAGPEGVDYERLWWAADGHLPPNRVEEITRPVPF